MPLGSKMAPTRLSLASIALQWEKHKKNLLLRNHKAQSFHILCVAMYSTPLYNPANHVPGVHTGHTSSVSLSAVVL